jgi:hypothetical protein
MLLSSTAFRSCKYDFTSLIFAQCTQLLQDRYMFCWQIPELFESRWRLLLEAPDILLNIYIWWILWIEV